MSVQDLADAMGVHRTTIYTLEASEQPNPTLSVLLRLQSALRLSSLEQLLGGFIEFPSETLAPVKEAGSAESA